MRVELLVIDMQNDFSDDSHAALAVPGALADAKRLAGLIDTLGDRLDDIHATLDTHQKVAIFHPVFWVNSKGDHPAPFTQIALEDVEKGAWRAYNPQFHQRAHAYVESLKANGRYTLTIWPPHCLVGSWGHGLIPSIAEAFSRWEDQFARVDFVTKGHNIYTEHYSAVQADVPDPDDPTTQLNTRLVETLEQADLVLLAGQALSHCVANTITDIADNFGSDSVKKMVLLKDTTSPVPGFEDLAHDFLHRMTARGMQTACAANFSL